MCIVPLIVHTVFRVGCYDNGVASQNEYSLQVNHFVKL